MTAALTAEATSRFVDTPSGRVHYNEAGTGHPVVLLHGSGPGASGWSNFQPNLPALSQHFRCLAIDMPGWGASDSPAPEDRNHVQTLVEILDALKIERAAVIGNSMGGMTAIHFAAKHPDRISHLIAMGAPAPGARIFSQTGLTEGLKILIAGYADPSPSNFKQLVSIMAFDQRFATDELAAERAANASARPEHAANFLAGFKKGIMNGPLSEYQKITPQLMSSKTPTLIIHGRDDRTVHMEHGLQLVTTIPDSRLLIINRCAHWAQLEHADEFNRVVTDFVSSRL